MLVSHLHVEPGARRGDGQVAVTQPAHQIKRLARGLLVREPYGVIGHVALDGRAHLRRHAEESVRRHQATQRLVGPLEVIGRDEEANAAVAIRIIREDRAREKLVPQRLPEALNLAHGLRMLRPALDVPNAVLAQLLLEFRLAAPDRVLPTLVRQNLFGRPIVRNRATESLHHQARALMVRQRKRADESRVVVHEARQVQALVLAQQKREDVALPKLIGLGPLEAPRWVLARSGRRALLGHEACLVQNRAHLRLGDAQRLEA
jgi:hypothetical protein